VKREALQKTEAEPKSLRDQSTLHDASLGAHMDAAVQKVNVGDFMNAIVAVATLLLPL
jgi:hypothetical protein